MPVKDFETGLRPAFNGLLDRVPARHWLIASDFDGTLSEIVAVPSEAAPAPGALDAIQSALDAVAAFAIISGRSRHDLERVLPVPGLRLLGDYGRPQPSADELHALDQFNAQAADVTRTRPGTRLEVKPGSTSVHYRDRPEAGAGLIEALAPLAAARGLEAKPGRMVVEVVPAGWDKARALEALVSDLRPGAVVFAGDDRGDRGCFEFLRGLDLPHLAVGVASGEAEPGNFDACDVVVDGPGTWVKGLRLLAAEAANRR